MSVAFDHFDYVRTLRAILLEAFQMICRIEGRTLSPEELEMLVQRTQQLHYLKGATDDQRLVQFH